MENADIKKSRTIIYIDGFNFYYGALKNTKFKWLDLQTLFHKLLDACHNRYDCAVLVSNDSDIAEALKFVKTEHKKKIGLIIPGHRYKSKVLMKYKDFIKEIRHSVLADSQLPNPIPGTNIYKPASW